MMSGDSPSSHTHEHSYDSDLKEPGRCIPTTSSSRCAESGASAVILEPKTIITGDGRQAKGDSEPDHNYNDDEAIETAENNLLACNQTLTDEDLCTKMNGKAGDCTDGGKWPEKDAKKDEEEEESCGIKCLYYTLQCCECTIL